MDISSLPYFPPPLPPKSWPKPQRQSWKPTRRQQRILIDLMWLIGFSALVLWAKHTADALQRPQRPTPPAPSVEFQEVLRQYPSVWLQTSEAETRARLGTPTRYVGWGSEMVEWEAKAEQSHRHLGIPRERLWLVWADPEDEARWVAVLIARGEVYWRANQGVGPQKVADRKLHLK